MDTNNKKTAFDPVCVALYAIEHPEFRNSEKFREWLLVDNHKVLFEEICRKAANGLDRLKEEEIDREWMKWRSEMRRIRLKQVKVWTSVAAVAAVLVGAIFWINVKPMAQPAVVAPEYTAVLGMKEVTVQVDRHHPLVIAAGKEDAKGNISVVDLGHLHKPVGILPMTATASEAAVHEMVITVPRGRSCHFMLEDGSEVWLNADSRLKYQIPFAPDERVVELEGEGFFKVAKNKKQPFYVHTKYFTTQVLGTEFNVRSYHREDAGVTLVEGSVRVKDEVHEALIHPGEQARPGEDGFTVETVDIRPYKAWMEGYFFFDGTTLGDIMKELGRWYNVNIEFADPETAAYKFNYWAYRTEDFQHAIAILNRLGKVSVVIEDNKAVIHKQ